VSRAARLDWLLVAALVILFTLALAAEFGARLP
jgi:hypothetical protein